ncbi:DUF2971 domain-containing protein [Pectobacterium versatile]|uniref:DUF2971 domain-containing protein n=1 Tax=Pectobacterium versatile TaxID=2488639 RepID=UPI00380CD980
MAIIYHYCSQETFLNIVKNKKIWLCATNNMNDSAEGVWVQETLKSLLSRSAIEEDRKRQDEIYRCSLINNNLKYISCFSKGQDILSQWRAYAQNGCGVAIGFDEGKLARSFSPIYGSSINRPRLDINDVIYLSDSELESLLIEKMHLNGIYLDLDSEFPNAMQLISFSFEVDFLSSVVKKVAFKEEEEKRIIYKADVLINDDREVTILNAVSKMYHRISGEFLTSYFEFGYSNDAISEIVLGPKNKFNEFDVEKFMRVNDFKNTKIIRSAATYR